MIKKIEMIYCKICNLRFNFYFVHRLNGYINNKYLTNIPICEECYKKYKLDNKIVKLVSRI